MMARTVVVTGSSTGIGRATAIRMHDAGWNVVASMRSPDRAEWVPSSDRFVCPRLDVTDLASIKSVVQSTIEGFGQVVERRA